LQEEVQQASSSKQQAACKRQRQQQTQPRRQRHAPSAQQQPVQLQEEQVEEHRQPHPEQQQQQATPALAQAPMPKQLQEQPLAQHEQLPAASVQPGQQEQQQQQQAPPPQTQQAPPSPAAAPPAAAAATIVLPEGYALEDFSSVPAVLAQLPGLLRHLGAAADLRARLQAALLLQLGAGTRQQPKEGSGRLALLQGQYGLLQLCVEQRDVDMTRSSLDGLLTMLGA
jgi:hypothetical protein